MPFFARPDLSDEQFKQLKGSELALSGQTQIATTTGLTLSDGSGNNIIVTASGASSNFDVLTYCDGVISLKPSSSSGGTGIYDGTSPSTCTVGGLSANTNIYGCDYTTLFQCILAPTLNPVLTSPSLSSFVLTPSTTIYEVGCSIGISGTASLNRGCINPQYSATCDKRVCNATCYVYGCCGIFTAVASVASSNTYSFGTMTIDEGDTVLSARACHSDGVQPKNSSGVDYDSPFGSGQTNTITRTLCGTFSWYYGTKKGTNIITNTDVAAGTKGPITTFAFETLPIIYNSDSDDYLWFAVPDGTPEKTEWYVCASNQGVIGGTNNLFASSCTVTGVISTFGCVSSYNVYVSCITTGTASGVPMCMS